jgi:hypothetical protein
VEKFKCALVRRLRMMPSLMPDWNALRSTGFRPGSRPRLLSSKGAPLKPICQSTRKNQAIFMWWSDGLVWRRWESALVFYRSFSWPLSFWRKFGTSVMAVPSCLKLRHMLA